MAPESHAKGLVDSAGPRKARTHVEIKKEWPRNNTPVAGTGWSPVLSTTRNNLKWTSSPSVLNIKGVGFRV